MPQQSLRARNADEHGLSEAREGRRAGRDLAVGPILGVYNHPKGSERYNKITRFVEAFFTQFDKFLSPQRHPKWRRSIAALGHRLDPLSPGPGLAGPPPQQEVASQSELDRFLDEQPPGLAADKEQVYQAYLKWRQEHQRLSGSRDPNDTRLSRP